MIVPSLLEPRPRTAAAGRDDRALAVLAHELNNPLAALANAGELLAQLARGDTRLERVAEIVGRQTAMMRGLVEQLLDVGRLDAERLELTLRRLDAREAARDSLEDHRPLLEGKGLRCELVVPPEPVWVRADALRLAQVLGNVLVNAAKFTPPPGRVTVAVEASAAQALLAVHDTGVGMTREVLAVVFERYRQASRGSHGGLGLGLPIARAIVERHGGAVEAASDGVGRGSTIRIRLPLAHRDPPDVDASRPSLAS